MNIYSISEFSDLIGMSIRTLERWDKSGDLVAFRTPRGRRYYTDEHYKNYRKKPMGKKPNDLYIRVSCSKQKVFTQEEVDSLKLFCKQTLGVQVEMLEISKAQSK